MKDFVYENHGRIVFGRGAETKVGEEVATYSDNILLVHYGDEFIRSSGILDRVIASLKEHGIQFTELTGVKPNPRLSLVREGIELARKHRVGLVLGIGGGSVTDTCKAIALGARYGGDIRDFFGGKQVATDALPVGAIVTIPASGSENSSNFLVKDEETNEKTFAIGPALLPKFAVLNPELTLTLPKSLTAAGCADIIAHAMERYWMDAEYSDFSHALCEATIKSVIRNSLIVMDAPDDYEARANIMWAAIVAHNDFLTCGRGKDQACHMIEKEITGLYDNTHGAGLAAITPHWMRYIYQKKLDRFARFAVQVWGVEMDLDRLEWTAREGITRHTSYYERLGLATTLSGLGIPNDQFETIAENAAKFGNGTVGRFVKLTKEDVLHILRMAE